MRAVFLATLIAASAASASPAGAQTLTLTRLRGGNEAFTTYSGVTDSLRLVVRDSASWRRFWREVHRPFTPAPLPPLIDFAHEMVVAAALGARPTGGYEIVIEGAQRDSAGIEIAVRRTSPAPGCPVEAATTQPVDIARLSASDAPVRFRERNVVVPCGAR